MDYDFSRASRATYDDVMLIYRRYRRCRGPGTRDYRYKWVGPSFLLSWLAFSQEREVNSRPDVAPWNTRGIIIGDRFVQERWRSLFIGGEPAVGMGFPVARIVRSSMQKTRLAAGLCFRNYAPRKRERSTLVNQFQRAGIAQPREN